MNRVEQIDSSWLHDAITGEGITAIHAKVMEVAWKHGGYIAGGFARKAAAISLDLDIFRGPETVPAWKWRELTSYTRLSTMTFVHQDTRVKREYGGDIDFFFLNEVGAREAIRECIAKFGEEARHSTSPAGFAREMVLDDCKFQFITKVSGTPEEVFDSFDLANAKIALTRNSIIMMPGWKKLELDRTLGIDRFDKINLLWRVKKWVKKHRYASLRPGDEDKFVDVVFNAMEKTKDNALKRWDRPVTRQEIVSFVKMFLHTMPSTSILKAAMLLDDYDKMNAVKIISNRSIKNRTTS